MDNNGFQQNGQQTGPVIQLIQQAPAQKEEKKFLVRHMIWFTCIMSLLFILFGQLGGQIFLWIVKMLFNIKDGGTLFLFMYLQFFGIIVLLFLYMFFAERPILRTFGYKAKDGGEGNTFAQFGLGILTGFGMNALCILAAWLHGDIDFYVGTFDVLYMLPGIICVCIQSGAEELITRGYILGTVGKNYGLPAAAIVNSLFFGALHLMNPGVTAMAIINIVLIGLGLSLAAIYLRSVWFPIAVHTAWNYCQSLFFGLPNSGAVSEKSFLHLEAAASTSPYYDAAFGVEASWPAFVVEMGLIAVFGILLIVRHKKEKAGDALSETAKA